MYNITSAKTNKNNLFLQKTKPRLIYELFPLYSPFFPA